MSFLKIEQKIIRPVCNHKRTRIVKVILRGKKKKEKAGCITLPFSKLTTELQKSKQYGIGRTTTQSIGTELRARK